MSLHIEWVYTSELAATEIPGPSTPVVRLDALRRWLEGSSPVSGWSSAMWCSGRASIIRELMAELEAQGKS